MTPDWLSLVLAVLNIPGGFWYMRQGKLMRSRWRLWFGVVAIWCGGGNLGFFIRSLTG